MLVGISTALVVRADPGSRLRGMGTRRVGTAAAAAADRAIIVIAKGPRMTENYINSNGVRIWTVVQGSGVPFLLCNGGPGCCD